jgi:hypothetical protein
MYKGHKARELSINELSVGMEVAFVERSYYAHRYTSWVLCKIEKLTPKKTKVTLDDGRTLKANECHTGLYHFEEWMKEESALATMDNDAIRILYDMHNTDFTSFVASVSEEDMPEVYGHIVALGNRIKEYKEKRKNKVWY